jgi:hypothetical protein
MEQLQGYPRQEGGSQHIPGRSLLTTEYCLV